MASQTTSQFAKPRIDARALLGLYDPPNATDWGPIRAAQMNAGGQLALLMLAANLLGAALVTLGFTHRVPPWQLGGWGVLVAATSAAVAFRRLFVRYRTAKVASLKDVRDTVLDGLALGTAWSIAPIMFGSAADADAALGLWIVLAILMAASAVAMAALPLATITFMTVLGGAIASWLSLTGSPALGAASLLFTALLIFICFARSKSLVLIRAGEIALNERDETVSLLLREFEENAADWLWETDAQRRVIRANPRFAASLGAEPTVINDAQFLQILAGTAWDTGNFAPGLREMAEKLKRREPFRDLLLPVQIGSGERWWELTGSPRFDDEGSFCGFRGVGSDVTEARESANKISRMARYDTLTGLPNRLLINETLALAMSEADQWGSRCAFMMIDLDRFKAINDTLGHPVGDRLLMRVSERLKQLMSDKEMIGRLGGDEFAVVVRKAADTAAVERLAHGIIDALSHPYEVDQHTLNIGASIGLAFGPRDGRTAETLIRSADLALYRSKDAGGGVFHTYEPELHVHAEERRLLELALRAALENDEFHLLYQPVVQASSGALTGFEALLRWMHPEYGNITPAKFIPLAEETRLIAPIGEWVLRRACIEAARWDHPLRIAVNVSSEQLHDTSFVACVAQALEQSGLHPDRLELEVTESVFMREGTAAVQTLEKILDLGVHLSLDDFGTGPSSLGYLSRTRLSSIKVDHSFVHDASQGSKEAIAIIRAVVALGDTLGIATTAEGVETENEYRLIQALGCTKAQGYYFGRPLPVTEARSLTTFESTNVAA